MTIPDTVTSIGYAAFRNCGGITSVTIPESVTRIGTEAFIYCDLLEEITIPSSVTEIGEDAFAYTPWAREQMEDRGILVVNQMLVAVEEDIDELVIPDSVERISLVNRHLTTVFIPASVTRVDACAFDESALETVYYEGSESDWENIEIEEDNDELLGAEIHYNAVPTDIYLDGDDEAFDGAENTSGLFKDLSYQQLRTKLVELKELLNDDLIPRAVYESSVEKLMDRFVSQ